MRIQRPGQKHIVIGNPGLSIVSPRGGAAIAGPVILDTFTDTNATAIADHTPDTAPVGSAWSNLVSTASIVNNRMQFASDGSAIINSGISDFTITADVTVYIAASTYARTAKIIFRHNLANGTNWSLAVISATLALSKNGTAIAAVDISALGLTEKQVVTLKVVTDGTSIKGYVNDGYEVSATSADYQTDTYVGVGCFRNSTNTYFADNFQVDAVTPTPPIDNLVAFGDSITVGYEASDAAHRYANIVATTKGWTLVNAGIGDTVLQNTVQNTVATIGAACDNNGRDTYTTRVNDYDPTKVIILYGLNDLRLDDAAFSDTEFSTDLGAVVDGIVANGILAANITIGSPTYLPAASYALYAPWDGGSAIKHAAYVAACAAVAAAKGCGYADVYQAMADGGGDTLISADGIHPNDSGHAVIAAAILAEL